MTDKKAAEYARSELEKATRADDRKKGSVGFLDVIEGVGFAGLLFGAPVLIPAALALGTLALIDEITPNDPEAKKRKMPDEWLEEVSRCESISPKGLKYLSGLIKKQGHVTVYQAGEWLKIEQEVSQEIARKAQQEKATSAPGASSLLKRAEQSSPGLMERVGLGGVVDQASKQAEAALQQMPGAKHLSSLVSRMRS